MTIEDIIEDRTPLVFAADQEAFEIDDKYFCLLYPLMTIDGEVIDGDARLFPNRGRVWWMVRTKTEIVPGSIWVGTIENAYVYEINNPEKDRFQATSKIGPGHEDLIEIIDVGDREPDPALLFKGRQMDRYQPTLPVVYLRGREKVLGPLRAAWNKKENKVTCEPLLPSRPEVLVIPTETFNQIVKTASFRVPINEYSRFNADHYLEISFTFTLKKWVNLDELRKNGTVLDASNDASIISWAVKRLEMGRANSALVKEFFRKIDEDEALLSDNRYKRLEAISKHGKFLLELDENIARLLTTIPQYGQLVERHVAAISQQRIEEQIAARQEEVRKEIASLQRQKETLVADIRQLASDFDRKRKEQEKEIEKSMGRRLQDINELEAKLAARESALARQEEELRGRLEHLIKKYAEESERISEEFLLHYPFIARLTSAIPRQESSAQTEQEVLSPATLTIPAFLETSKITSRTISEQEFVKQFQRVIRHQGYSFGLDEIINFHVCMKIGGLTILAGPSGTGKSSLPRLYAKALGCSDEFLHIPVRPDWMDDRDFIGVYNPLSRRFEPAVSGLVDRLIAARIDLEEGRGGIYLVCLDEMNLSRVEHYFAQFLSMLELSLEERFITLFPESVAQAQDPYTPYRIIPLNNNVKFVGAVNIDETTHFFSPKVLDRSQVLSFPCPDLSHADSRIMEGMISDIVPVTLDTLESWVPTTPDLESAKGFILKLNDILQQSRCGITFRPYHRMLAYISSARELFESEDKAIDFQLLQIVLPRLRPTAALFGKTLGELKSCLSPARFPRSAEMIRRIEESGHDYDYFQLI